ncbi:cytoplasmic protein [Calocera cornea HHB12733]|uniref:Cytoplasmic protein n=1 Tax=Calocera cornea HHB12733 TaxID=1353952 RepID=A0A165I3V8_9BASI|nr:cytoplasmic protein [Calocera cornea HHB12733]
MSLPLFPPLTRSNVLACQLSSWYPTLASVSIKTVTIRPLDVQFRDYLLADGVHIPLGSEGITAADTLSEDESDEDEGEDGPSYTFPQLDTSIRKAIADFGAVFPKLNWSSPKDAAWMLPQSSPLKCTSPADVYLLLKSSDFVNHDLDPSIVFEGCEEDDEQSDFSYELELSLRKWYAIDKGREFRCFVRDNMLLGASQRDHNYYEYLNESETQELVLGTIGCFWRDHLLEERCPVGPHYVFDLLLTRDLRRAHLIDINPFAPRTDPLIFTYAELQELARMPSRPKLAVIESTGHADAARNAPLFQHNMVPLEALQLSAGRTPQDFTNALAEEIRRSAFEDA